MKRIAKSIIWLFLLLNLVLTVQIYTASAEESDCVNNMFGPGCMIYNIGKDTKLPDFENYDIHPEAPDIGEIGVNEYEYNGADTVTSPIYYAIDMFRFAISGIAMIFILITAAKLIGSESDEDLTKARKGMLFAVIGLIVIQFASVIVKNMFFGTEGMAFAKTEKDEYVYKLFALNTAEEISGLIGLIEQFVAATAVLIIVIGGFRLIIGLGDDEGLKKAKNQIMYASIGIILVAISEVFIRGFLFPNEGDSMPDISVGIGLLVSATKFISSFVAIASFVMLFYAGYLYVSGGVVEENVEKAKKVLLGAVIGIILALGAFAAINTVLHVPEGGEGAEYDRVQVVGGIQTK